MKKQFGNELGGIKKQVFYIALIGVICLAGAITFRDDKSKEDNASQIKLAQEGNRTLLNDTNDDKTIPLNPSKKYDEIKPEDTLNPSKKYDEIKQEDKQIVDKKDDSVSTQKDNKQLDTMKSNDDKTTKDKNDNTEDRTTIMSKEAVENVMSKGVGNEKEILRAHSFDKAKGLVWPVEGEIILDYNIEEPVYYKTIGSFMTNDGIVIAATEGESVKCGCDGTITNIYEDSRYGKMIDISVGDNYTISYGQLSSIQVNVGDEVKTNQVIAKVAKTTDYFEKEGNNVYMKVRDNDSSINPNLLLK